MTVRLGESARLYDIAYQVQLQQTIIGSQLRDYYGFITPPFLAWLFAPLSALPYLWSFALWSVLGLAALWLSLRLLAVLDPQRTGLWVLMFFPVFAAISYGQNSLLSLLLLSLVYSLWRRGHGWMAGLTASLLLYKPQLIVGVGLLWLLEWLWPAPEERGRDLPLPPQGGVQEGRGPSCRTSLLALLGLSVGGGLLIGMCFWLMPEASRAYVTFARTVLPDLPAWQEFPLWNLHSIWGFWRLLLPNAKAWADRLYWFSTLVGIAGFAWIMSRLKQRRPRLLFAAAISLTLWATPHAMIYDWALLLIPAILLWQDAPMLREQLRPIYALIWIAAFISGPLTRSAIRLAAPSSPNRYSGNDSCNRIGMLVALNNHDRAGSLRRLQTRIPRSSQACTSNAGALRH